LSLYIETEKHRILFDTGSSGAFADNALAMGIDLGKVDFVVLSHGHYDHGGGLGRFAAMNPTAPIYVSCHAFSRCYNARGKYIGLDPALRSLESIHYVRDHIWLDEDVELFPGVTVLEQYPMDTGGMAVAEGDCTRPDQFLHEQYLLIREHGKTVLISGCSHRGIENIVNAFRCDVLVGGFHFMKLEPDDPRIEQAAQVLLSHSAVFYTGHCTGQAQFLRLKEIMGDRLYGISTGDTIIL
jgi:7,8-dihydropterin-6-yl-methyl-4-(beta-D-ribofuranosyl)aminobenzene 5'-phosphate synthase